MRDYEYAEYPEYISVGERRARAEKKLQQLQKKNPHLKPVILAGQTLAMTWWGKSWNNNLERYADYHNRIERGRSYVRHRCVLDLQLTPGKITAMVQGSRSQPYDVVITVDPLSSSNWAAIRQACAGCFDSLSELLSGKFPQALKDRFFEKGSGLFPTPREIHFDCSCPDWASMCKHVAAALYGVGARLDDDARLFFTLRGININDVITQTVTDTAQTLLGKAERQSRNILHDVDLGDVFGIQLDDMVAPLPDLPPARAQVPRPKKPTTTARQARAPQAGPRVDKTLATQRSPQHRHNTAATRKAVNPPVTSRKTGQKSAAAALPARPQGTMLDALVKAVGKARQGKAVGQLQEKLGWTKAQVRNAISRAAAKGLLETVHPGIYRRKV